MEDNVENIISNDEHNSDIDLEKTENLDYVVKEIEKLKKERDDLNEQFRNN